MADSEDQINLKKRARRRLVGAIALVTFVVIVLPMVFDKEPKPLSRDISIQIPNPDSSAFHSKMVPVPPPVTPPASAAPAPAPAADNSKAATKPDARPESKGEAKQKAPPENKPAAPPATAAQAATELGNVAAPAARPPQAADAKSSPGKGVKPETSQEKKSAPAGPNPAAPAKPEMAGGAWVVKLGAFADKENVKRLQAQLSAAGIKSYTESLDSPQGQRTRVRAGPYPTRAAAERAHEKLKKMGHAGVVGEK